MRSSIFGAIKASSTEVAMVLYKELTMLYGARVAGDVVERTSGSDEACSGGTEERDRKAWSIVESQKVAMAMRD